MASITFTNIPQQMANDLITRYGSLPAAKAACARLIVEEYNKWKSDQADAAAVASRIAPTPVDPATVTVTIA